MFHGTDVMSFPPHEIRSLPFQNFFDEHNVLYLVTALLHGVLDILRAGVRSLACSLIMLMQIPARKDCRNPMARDFSESSMQDPPQSTQHACGIFVSMAHIYIYTYMCVLRSMGRGLGNRQDGRKGNSIDGPPKPSLLCY